MNICFVDTTKLNYSFKDLHNEKIRGSEASIIYLSQKLSELGNNIVVFNNTNFETNKKKYSWFNLNKINSFKNSFDIVISNNDNQVLSKFNCKKKFVLSHSILTIEKALRKKQFFSYFENKPEYIFLGNYHKNKMSKLFTLYGSSILNYGVDEVFEKPIEKIFHDKNLSFFISRPDRNLDLLLDVWKDKIYPRRNNSKLYITPIEKELEKFNIFNRQMLDKIMYIKQIQISRMVILPGHQAELFCIAALEALELCLPIVTMGIGSLSERVEHNVTGLISKDTKTFAKNILDLYNDDYMWNEIKTNLLKKRGNNSWKKASLDLLQIINK